MYNSIADLRSQLGQAPKASDDPVYREKMIHPFPLPEVVNREKFILDHCKGKRVLDIGASGPMHTAILAVAKSVFGIDREDGDGVVGFDLDDVSKDMLPYEQADVIVCGEVIEHLSNPGWFLTRLKRQYGTTPLIITVPNAFAEVSQRYIKKNIECVNRDHVAWYSPKTISVLLERAGYKTGGLFWYGGKGPTAEGLVVVTE